jgi:hypothetical protein
MTFKVEGAERMCRISLSLSPDKLTILNLSNKNKNAINSGIFFNQDNLIFIKFTITASTEKTKDKKKY